MLNTLARPAGSAMRLTPRDVDIIGDVAAYTVMTRDQIQRKRRIGSVPRANAVLIRLVRANYLSRRYQPTVVGTRRPVYFVGPRGAELLNGAPLDGVRTRAQVAGLSDLFVQHQLALSDVRMVFEQSQPGFSYERWTSDLGLRDAHLGLIPDGYVEFAADGQRFTAFVEVDLGTESLTRWRSKVEEYIRLAHSGLYRKVFNRQFFRTLVVTPSERRVVHLQREIAVRTSEIFWLATTADLIARGPLAAIWRRPGHEKVHQLTQPT